MKREINWLLISPFPVASSLHHQLLLFLPCFFGWVDNPATFDVLFYLIYGSTHIKPWCLSTRRNWLFYALRCQVYEVWHMLLFAGTLIWYHTHKHIHTTHSGGVNRLTHPYNYILTNTNCFVLKAAICITLGHFISTELEPKPPRWPLQIFMKLLPFDLII